MAAAVCGEGLGFVYVESRRSSPPFDGTAIFHPVLLPRPIAWPVLVGVLAIAAPSWGQGDAAAMAEALFNQGQEAFDAEDFDTACARFRESDRIDPQPGTKLNLARCEKARGRIATAWALYKTVFEVLPRDDDRREHCRVQIEELEPRLPRLTVTLAEGTPTNTVVRLGEIEVRPDGFGTPLPVDPGPLGIVVTSPGHEPNERRVDLAEAERASLEVRVGPAIPEPPKPPPPPPPPPPESPGLSGQEIAGWTIGAVGLTALLAGGGTGIGGLVRKADGEEACSDPLMLCSAPGKAANDEARSLLYATTGLWIAGGVAAAVGLTLVLTSGADDATPTMSVETRVGPQLTGLTWTLQF